MKCDCASSMHFVQVCICLNKNGQKMWSIAKNNVSIMCCVLQACGLLTFFMDFILFCEDEEGGRRSN